MRDLLFVLLTLGAVGVLEASFYLLRFLRQRRSDTLRRRLRALGDRAASVGVLRERRYASSPLLNSLLAAVPLSRRLYDLLEQADVSLSVARLLLYGGLGASGAFFLGLLAGGSILLGVVLAAVVAFLPMLYLLGARHRRSQSISEQLPETLELIARALRAGNALSNALQLVAAEMPEPISVEFGRAYEEQRLGVPLERAITNMTNRVPTNQDLRILAVSILVQKETGGNLAEILDKIAETIRARYRFYGKVRALTAEGRVSGIVLALLPLVMTLILIVINREYFQEATGDKLGQAILGYAVVSWMLGVVWLQRLTKVEL